MIKEEETTNLGESDGQGNRGGSEKSKKKTYLC